MCILRTTTTTTKWKSFERFPQPSLDFLLKNMTHRTHSNVQSIIVCAPHIYYILLHSILAACNHFFLPPPHIIGTIHNTCHTWYSGGGGNGGYIAAACMKVIARAEQWIDNAAEHAKNKYKGWRKMVDAGKHNGWQIRRRWWWWWWRRISVLFACGRWYHLHTAAMAVNGIYLHTLRLTGLYVPHKFSFSFFFYFLLSFHIKKYVVWLCMCVFALCQDVVMQIYNWQILKALTRCLNSFVPPHPLNTFISCYHLQVKLSRVFQLQLCTILNHILRAF